MCQQCIWDYRDHSPIPNIFYLSVKAFFLMCCLTLCLHCCFHALVFLVMNISQLTEVCLNLVLWAISMFQLNLFIIYCFYYKLPFMYKHCGKHILMPSFRPVSWKLMQWLRIQLVLKLIKIFSVLRPLFTHYY